MIVWQGLAHFYFRGLGYMSETYLGSPFWCNLCFRFGNMNFAEALDQHLACKNKQSFHSALVMLKVGLLNVTVCPLVTLHKHKSELFTSAAFDWIHGISPRGSFVYEYKVSSTNLHFSINSPVCCSTKGDMLPFEHGMMPSNAVRKYKRARAWTIQQGDCRRFSARVLSVVRFRGRIAVDWDSSGCYK